MRFLAAILLIALMQLAGARAHAQVIERESDLSYLLKQTDVHLDLYGSALYLSNATGASNLSPALVGHASSDTVLSAGVDLGVNQPISDHISAFADAGLSDNWFTQHSTLNYNNIEAQIGLVATPVRRLQFQLTAHCHDERDSHFSSFYTYCGPAAALGARAFVIGRRDPTTVDFVARYELATGARSSFANFQSAEAQVVFSRGTGRWQISGGPQIEYRAFNSPIDLFFPEKRSDWKVSVPITIERRFGERLYIGATVSGVANWSNNDTFRYWNVMAGPSIRYRFGR